MGWGRDSAAAQLRGSCGHRRRRRRRLALRGTRARAVQGKRAPSAVEGSRDLWGPRDPMGARFEGARKTGGAEEVARYMETL